MSFLGQLSALAEIPSMLKHYIAGDFGLTISVVNCLRASRCLLFALAEIPSLKRYTAGGFGLTISVVSYLPAGVALRVVPV